MRSRRGAVFTCDHVFRDEAFRLVDIELMPLISATPAGKSPPRSVLEERIPRPGRPVSDSLLSNLCRRLRDRSSNQNGSTIHPGQFPGPTSVREFRCLRRDPLPQCLDLSHSARPRCPPDVNPSNTCARWCASCRTCRPGRLDDACGGIQTNRRPWLFCLSSAGIQRDIQSSSHSRQSQSTFERSCTASRPCNRSEQLGRNHSAEWANQPPSAHPSISVPIAAGPSALLEQAAELANRGHFSEAIGMCEQHLRQKGLTAPAYYLMGMICQATGDRRRAEDCFQKTVYLDPRHDEALLALALLAERRGDQNAAAGFRRRARTDWRHFSRNE